MSLEWRKLVVLWLVSRNNRHEVISGVKLVGRGKLPLLRFEIATSDVGPLVLDPRHFTSIYVDLVGCFLHCLSFVVPLFNNFAECE